MRTLSPDHNNSQAFIPNRIIRHAYLQTGLTTLKLDVPTTLRRSGVPILIDAGADETGYDDGPVRLLAYYSQPVTGTQVKGAAILLHGWEGTSHSNYCLITAREMTAAGYHVIRLNLRDHGPGIHVHPQALNPGVFLGTLLDETVTAIIRCAELLAPLPIALIGFSMGGNFALRTAAQCADRPIPRLDKVIAVNPAVSPLRSTVELDRNPILRSHFRRPWMTQLLEKQKYYPDLYDFAPVQEQTSLIDMTNWLVDYLGYYRDAEDYFAHYAFLGDASRKLAVRTHIVATVDDPICPVEDIHELASNENLTIDIHPYGGHVGYVDLSPIQTDQRYTLLVHCCGRIVRQIVDNHQYG